VIDELGLEINALPLDFTESVSKSIPHQGPKEPAPPTRIVDLSELERRLLSELALGEATIDSLSAATQVPAGRISAALLQLEMKRLVRQLPGKYFSKAG
jgi:DNA processing protein